MRVGSLAALLACAACASAQPRPVPPPAQAGSVPAWVDQPPASGKAKLFALGYSAPTYWPQDALRNASEDARGKLALAIASHVEVLGLGIGRETGDGGAQIEKEAADVVLQNSRIDATWVDVAGLRGARGATWALASLELDSVRPQATTWTTGAPGQAPSWLERLPGSRTKIFATGYSGPTFTREDAVKYAGQAAVDNLAASLRSRVQAYTLLVETKAGLSVDEFSSAEDPDEAFRELVRKNAKVEATWVDRDGIRAGDPKGAVWALASIDVPSASGGAKPVENKDLGPALDAQGNAPAPADPAEAQPR